MCLYFCLSVCLSLSLCRSLSLSAYIYLLYIYLHTDIPTYMHAYIQEAHTDTRTYKVTCKHTKTNKHTYIHTYPEFRFSPSPAARAITAELGQDIGPLCIAARCSLLFLSSQVWRGYVHRQQLLRVRPSMRVQGRRGRRVAMLSSAGADSIFSLLNSCVLSTELWRTLSTRSASWTNPARKPAHRSGNSASAASFRLPLQHWFRRSFSATLIAK